MDEELQEVKEYQVHVVKDGEKQSLVQWIANGNLHRATIANVKVKEGYAKESELQKAVPYGLDFAEILVEFILPDKNAIVLAFHNHGIWTAADVRANPQSVIAALSSIYSPILKFLMQYIKAKKI